MKRRLRYYRMFLVRYDLPAGLTVFFVALPLCLGIALASGAPLYSGILSGIIGGLVVSSISRSQLSVSGPAAGLTTVVAAAILSSGDYRVFLLSVIIAGILQVILGVFKLGTIANYFPSAVIKGMLAAIGIMLISKQIPVALGYDQPDFWSGGVMNVFSTDRLSNSFDHLNHHTTTSAILISVISVALLIVLQKYLGNKFSFLPPVLIVVLIAVISNLLFTQAASAYSLKQTQLVNIPSNIFSHMVFPDLSKIFSSGEIWKNGIMIGMLASLETLLCVEAIDKLDPHNRITPVNRELVAQGIGNIACGFVGAIPLTAVIVRGAANVDAGARTRLSAFTHGVFLLLAVLLVPFLLNKIPYAVLAAILIVTGYNLTKPKLYRNMWELGKKQFLPFILTIIIILFTDLLVGVTAGLVLSAYFIIQQNFKAEYKIRKTKEGERDVFYIKLNTNVTFLNKVNLRQALDDIPPGAHLTIDGAECNFIDYDILEIISEFENKAVDKHIKVDLKGIKKVNVTAIH
jgi:MFS superfamily sulfate permease-like transporter